MDKLSEHAIRMLEIEGKGKNDGYIETRNMGDIARAVYDTILQVQMLKTALLHKTEPTCDTCRHKGVEGCEQPCLGCGCCGLYEAMTGNDKLKEKVVEFIKSCARCKHRPIGAMMCEESCHYEPKTE